MIPKERLTKRVELPEGVTAEIAGETVKIKGPKGEVERNLVFPTLKIKQEGNQLVLEPIKFTKKEKTMINTFESHLKNMIKGVTEGYVYKLKICSGHFPMNVAVNGNEVIVKNLFGEKIPRKAKIEEGVQVKINGTEVEIEGVDKEKVGQTAGNIEQSCRITNRDRRIFQDGIWITHKGEKEL